MRFELDEILTNEILFHMENQNEDFVFEVHAKKIINKKESAINDADSFVPLPEWKPQDGYRLMEKFASELKNPSARVELTDALNRKKGVFRSFKNALDHYPEIEKLWFRFKQKKMKDVVFTWYNSLREEWGLQPIGAEPEDNSSLVLEDFTMREGKDSDCEDATALHKQCIEEREEKTLSNLYEEINPFTFPGDLCIIAENANGEFCGYISAVKDSASHLRICQLEVQAEYRGIGLGKTLLSKFLEKAHALKLNITIDLPKDSDFFSRSLYLENFSPCAQRFVLKR
jgi:ribosomal protein S18 acetylase RimI-like enzyme